MKRFSISYSHKKRIYMPISISDLTIIAIENRQRMPISVFCFPVLDYEDNEIKIITQAKILRAISNAVGIKEFSFDIEIEKLLITKQGCGDQEYLIRAQKQDQLLCHTFSYNDFLRFAKDIV